MTILEGYIHMARKIEVFSAGCLVCDLTVDYIKSAVVGCEVIVLNTHKHEVAQRAIDFGIRCLPAIVVDGKLADPCQMGGPAKAILHDYGLIKRKVV